MKWGSGLTGFTSHKKNLAAYLSSQVFYGKRKVVIWQPFPWQVC